MLAVVDFARHRHNLQIVAISLGAGMIPIAAPELFHQMPPALTPIFDSGILLAALTALGLNFYFNGSRPHRDATPIAADCPPR
jgi:xanthine/uracil permease